MVETEIMQQIIDGLINLGAVKFGDFTLASGQHSSVYVDLRLLVSDPRLLALVADAYSRIVVELLAKGYATDRLAGVPYAALPIATVVSQMTGIPMIYTRKEAKGHGLGKDVEGLWRSGERVVIIEDVITTGGSIISQAERLRELGMYVSDAIALVDREQGGAQALAEAGIRSHSVFTLAAIVVGVTLTGGTGG